MSTWPYGDDTIIYGDYIWIMIMEKKMETSIVYGGLYSLNSYSSIPIKYPILVPYIIPYRTPL